VSVGDLDVPLSRMTEKTRSVIFRAVDEARRREHAWLASEHLFYALARVEWDLFAGSMREENVNPCGVLTAIDASLRLVPSLVGRDPGISRSTQRVCKLALYRATGVGRARIEPRDLLLGLFEDTDGVPAFILREYGIEPDVLVSRLEQRLRERKRRAEPLRMRFFRERPSRRRAASRDRLKSGRVS
jgi:ATP-dependent Clp protease ATP-binding subunit ClpA